MLPTHPTINASVMEVFTIRVAQQLTAMSYQQGQHLSCIVAVAADCLQRWRGKRLVTSRFFPVNGIGLMLNLRSLWGAAAPLSPPSAVPGMVTNAPIGHMYCEEKILCGRGKFNDTGKIHPVSSIRYRYRYRYRYRRFGTGKYRR